MSKSQPSKLDRHIAQLDQWFGVEKLTLAQVRANLKLDGVDVSESRLSVWWSERVRQLDLDKTLGDIATGSRDCKSFKAAFEHHPAPDMATIINLYTNIIMRFTAKAEVNPKMLQLADTMMRTAMEYSSGRAKSELEKRRLDLQERRVKLLEAKAAAYDRAQAILKNSGGITPETFKKIESELRLL